MIPVPFEVVPSAVNTLLPAFLQVLKAAGECLYASFGMPVSSIIAAAWITQNVCFYFLYEFVSDAQL